MSTVSRDANEGIRKSAPRATKGSESCVLKFGWISVWEPAHQLVKRLRANDGVLVGKGVERLYGQSLDAGFDADVAEGRGCKPVGGAEPMQQALPRAVSDHFFTKMTENLGLDSLHFKAGQVLDDSAGMQARGSLGPDSRVEDKARFGERGLWTRENLGQADGSRAEDHRVATLDDPHVGFPPLLRDPPVDARAEPIRMERSVKDLERKIGNPARLELTPMIRISSSLVAVSRGLPVHRVHDDPLSSLSLL